MDEKAPAVDETEKRLKSAVLHTLEEESEGLRKCEEELKVKKMRVAWFTKLSTDWKYEESIKWKGEVPAQPASKVRSSVKRKKKEEWSLGNSLVTKYQSIYCFRK